MKRAKKIVLISHCYLNVNSKLEGIAIYSSVLKQLINVLIEKECGIIQLPCVEQYVCGIKRWSQVCNQLDNPYYRKECQKLLTPIVEQVIDFYNNGYRIIGVIGVNGSPSCGVDYTCIGDWGGEFGEEYNFENKLHSLKMENKYGIMMDELRKLLLNANIDIPFIGLDESKPKNVKELILKNFNI